MLSNDHFCIFMFKRPKTVRFFGVDFGFSGSMFLSVSEASTIPSKNNQIQYKTPTFNNFNIIIGFSNNSKDDINNTHKLLVVKYADKNYGFSLGGGKSAKSNEKGITAWYTTENNTTFNILTFVYNENSIKTKYSGISLNYQIDKDNNEDDRYGLDLTF